MIDQHRVYTATGIASAAALYRAARQRHPALPGAEFGALTEDRSRPDWPIVSWRRFGFNTADRLAAVQGPLVEVGGPSPIWDGPAWDHGTESNWGNEVDIDRLPQPLLVCNLRPLDEALSPIGSRVRCDAFFRADATELPFRTDGIGAIFNRGLSAYVTPEDMCQPDVAHSRHSMLLRMHMLREAWRVIEPGGLLYIAGARLVEIGAAQVLGFKLMAYHGAPGAGCKFSVIRENVYIKPAR